MPTVRAETLRRMLRDLLAAAGTPSEPAETIGDSLVDANLAGHDSHGAIRVLQYLEEVGRGALDPARAPVVTARSGAMAVIDGGWGWGQPAMWLATGEAMSLAREFGLGLATIQRSYHIGRVAPYVEAVANEGMVGLAMANAGPAVAPYGGRSRVMGTNPIAWAIPRADGRAPIALDVATALVAEGKLRVARSKGLPAPPGAVVNVDGHASLDPNDFYDGGALLPFGGHKGSGFSILAQLLGWGLAGLSPERIAGHRGANGPVILAIDVGRIAPLEDFVAAVEEQATLVCAAYPAEGFAEVLLPGEPELAERARRQEAGIELPDTTWRDLLALADSYGVDTADWRAEAFEPELGAAS